MGTLQHPESDVWNDGSGRCRCGLVGAASSLRQVRRAIPSDPQNMLFSSLSVSLALLARERKVVSAADVVRVAPWRAAAHVCPRAFLPFRSCLLCVRP